MRAESKILCATALVSGILVTSCSDNGKSTAAGDTSTQSTGTTGMGGHTETGSTGAFGTSSSSTSSSTGAGGSCGNVTLMQKTVPGNLVVVFDQSDSMNQPFSTGGAPKYKVAEDAITMAVSADASLLNAGAIFFPTIATGNTCSKVDPIGTPPQIAIEPGAMFVTDFAGHFSAPAWTLILGTPTVDALKAVDNALPDPSPLKGARAVVLVTDGAPTCDTVQADMIAPVQAMAMRGIKTFVVGLPGSASASSSLNAIAMAGGTGMYVSPTDAMGLQMAFAQIASAVLDSCVITLNPPPANPNLVHLVVTDAAHPNGQEIMQGNGWTLSADGSTATLDGSVCAKAKSGGYTSIKFLYGCPTIQ